MMVLVETNFVLELVFARDNFASCGELIEMANNASIDDKQQGFRRGMD